MSFRCGDFSIVLAEVNGRKNLLKSFISPLLLEPNKDFLARLFFAFQRHFILYRFFLYPVDFRTLVYHRLFSYRPYAFFAPAGKRQRKNL